MNLTFYGCASITSSQRAQIIKKDGIPGPGTYDPTKQDSEQIPLWTLKPKIQYTSCFHFNNTFVPAPGSYDICRPEAHRKSDKENKLKIGKFKDRNSIEKCSPVIALQIPSFVDQHGGFSFGYRDEPIVIETSPGPIYHVGEKEEQARTKKIEDSSGFGFGTRSKFERGQNPGPGHYSPDTEKMSAASGKWTFSKSLRKTKHQDTNPTGPGEYNPQFYNTCRSFVLKGRHKYETKSDNYDTSPVSYNLPDTKTKRGTIFKKSPHKDIRDTSEQGPSPFSYNIQSSLKPGGYSLAKKLQTVDQNAENPGPGTYYKEDGLFAKNGGYICRKQGQKKKMVKGADNFCIYEPKMDIVQYKYPQFTFDQSQRSSPQSKSQLGPFSYNNAKPSNTQAYSMGKSIRFKPLNKQKSYGNLLNQGSCYSSCGYLPPYLKKKDSKKSQSRLITSSKENPGQQKQ